MDLVPGVLAGETRAVARMISLAEGGRAASRAAMKAIYRRAGRAHVVGLTGVPGSGKSTMVQALTRRIRASGRTVGIVAIDPSSPFSGGAILGDRVRMTQISGDPGVFIRSMATRGALGGLARASLDAVDVLDAAGFDVILIETVGVGQDEVDIVQAAHTVVVVSAPGLGDDIQAIKAGVLEIADIHTVSKCDRADAARTLADLRAMLTLRPHLKGGDWPVPVMGTSSQNGKGIDELVAAIDAHRAHLAAGPGLETRRRKILEMRILKATEDLVRRRLDARRGDLFADLLERVATREADPREAAEALLKAAVGEAP
ncbi:MAG: methylmalonyl Co-A mutase-associated GTPase MeaB [Rhodobacterales bacterium]|nr:methylmalonyl Co-A mutase-associated GTPase MeaB [Rhodobacterales bacterium]